jgi:hypothetical protein
MKLPNAEKAVIDEAKLESYSLSGEHGRGCDKARVFRVTMNLGPGDGPALASLLRERIKDDDVDEVENGEYGVVYVLHHPIVGCSLFVGFAMCGSCGTARTSPDWYHAIW